eukprot:CAMPEP_0197643516 /NCGR_PEP_ID=MMETSP1338-20131121/16809_1 /TAXON_ID=43686 ORGANISM="Pelagodinium beii, Strain RCC1491" /NCGR_SAMPLE_ID=MMETSP1338 /ASSEMBLY_ACC=CAM_ASM_000754 /LENGTH=84 /DNA_ID=CAMNT_0043216781 /DNA_START=148 /DNA_END=399 /DNA_ORIENTATION=+
MSLNPRTFTDKTNEALQKAEEICLENGNTQITPIHVALALFADQAGLANILARRCGASPDAINTGLRTAMQKLPRQDPAPTSVS